MTGEMGNTIIRFRDGIEVLVLLGPTFFLRKLGQQLMDVSPYFVLVHELNRGPIVPTRLDETVDLRPASGGEVAEFFALMAKGSKKSRYEYLVRKKFYERGFHDCYIGRIGDSGEMCSIVWSVSRRDVTKTRLDYPALGDDEVFGDNIYVLDKFRGKWVANATGLQHRAILRSQGFRRMLFFVKEDNLPSLKSCASLGDLAYKRIVRRKFLFRVSTIIHESFDPPIPIPISETSRG